MLFAALVAVASALPQAQDPLDALFARAAATKRLRAEFVLTRSASPEPVVYTLDYMAPDRMRLETRSEDGVTDVWVVGVTMSLRSANAGATWAFDVDLAAIGRDFQALKERARAAAPSLVAGLPQAKDQTYPVCQFQWGYDAKTDSGEFRFALGAHAKPDAPFGWLETARKKGVAWTRDGELLRAETDGRFQVALAPTGLLHEVTGHTGKGEMRFVLRSATFDQDPPADRFVVPAVTAAEGEAAKAPRQAFEASIRQSEALALRAELWRAWAVAKKGAADAAAAAKVDAEAKLAARIVLAPILAPRVEDMLRAVVGPTEEMVAQLVAQAGTDRSPENVAELRAKGADTVDAGLQRQLEKFGNLGGRRANAPPPAHLALEQDVIEAIYRELVVDVAVARFEAAFDKAMR